MVTVCFVLVFTGIFADENGTWKPQIVAATSQIRDSSIVPEVIGRARDHRIEANPRIRPPSSKQVAPTVTSTSTSTTTSTTSSTTSSTTTSTSTMMSTETTEFTTLENVPKVPFSETKLPVRLPPVQPKDENSDQKHLPLSSNLAILSDIDQE